MHESLRQSDVWIAFVLTASVGTTAFGLWATLKSQLEGLERPSQPGPWSGFERGVLVRSASVLFCSLVAMAWGGFLASAGSARPPGKGPALPPPVNAFHAGPSDLKARMQGKRGVVRTIRQVSAPAQGSAAKAPALAQARAITAEARRALAQTIASKPHLRLAQRLPMTAGGPPAGQRAASTAAKEPTSNRPRRLSQAVSPAAPTQVLPPEDPGLGYDPEEPTHIDFQNVDIKTVLRFLAEKTRTNYFLDPSISAKITVIGPETIPLSEAVTFLEAALEARGFTVIDSGTFKQVIPKSQAAKSPTPVHFQPVRSRGSDLEDEKTVTEIIQLRHAPVSEIKAAIQGLLSETSTLFEHAPTNQLIVTETIRNLRRIRRVLEELDVPVAGKRVQLLPVRYRKVEEMVKQITAILEKEEIEKRAPPTKELAATKPALLAEPAQNLLVVVATPADIRKIQGYLEKLDTDPDAGPEVEFLELRFAEPGTVAEKVQAAMKIPGVEASLGFTLVPDDRTQTLLLRTKSANLAARVREIVARLDREEAPLENARVRVFHLNFAEASKVAEILGDIDFGGKPNPEEKTPEVKIVADENTNSLLITATRDLFPAIEAVIQAIDVVKPQVLVEVLIAEVDYDWARGMGLDFNFLNEVSTSTNRPFAIGNHDIIESFAGGGLANGLNVGLLHGSNFDFAAAASGDLGEISKIAFLARLFQNTSHANILSSPVLMTSDNEEARIAIGERIQLPASFATAANTGLNTVTSFNSEDLGVILTITPRITRDDHVILAVDQQIKARTGDLLGALQTPVLSNREVTTSINAKNGETIVIGGLLSEDEQVQESKLPLLGDIPGLGKLFRSKQKSTRKTNLMIFLTPHILRNDRDSREVTRRGREELATQIERSQASGGSTIREAFEPGRALGRFRNLTGKNAARRGWVEIPEPGEEDLEAESQAPSRDPRSAQSVLQSVAVPADPGDRLPAVSEPGPESATKPSSPSPTQTLAPALDPKTPSQAESIRARLRALLEARKKERAKGA